MLCPMILSFIRLTRQVTAGSLKNVSDTTGRQKCGVVSSYSLFSA